jgi:hypothetical protein
MSEATRIRLTLASVAYLLMTAIHDLDHVRQGRPLATEVVAIGIVSVVASVTVLILSLRGHPFAPFAAIILGVGSLIGFVAVHLIPRWSVLSDPYGEAGVDALSYGIVYATMAAGAYLALVGFRTVRDVSVAD